MIAVVVVFQFLICSALCGTLVFLERAWARERSRLVNLALAKDPSTFSVLQQAAAREPAPAVRPRRPVDPDRPKAPTLPDGL